jgi:short-subunit dehydrogenase
VLEGKIALVTGASAGIGLSVSRKLAAAGARVAMAARTEKTLREAAASLPAGSAEAMVADVKDLAVAEALPRRVAEKFGGLDIVVNNAGLHHRGPMMDLEPLSLAEMVTVNLSAPIVIARAAAPLMQKGGAIVNVASLNGMVPVAGTAVYGATKFGLRAFSRASREELLPRGIRVCCVSPGPVDTGFFDAERERVADITFSQPMSSADEVAEAVMDCIREGTPEIALPRLSAMLCTLGYLSPGLTRLLRPALERRGARNKKAFFERRGAR